MKFWVFEKSAVECIINEKFLQSYDFNLSQQFISYLRGTSESFYLKGLAIQRNKDGIVFCGKQGEKTFILFDLDLCKLLENTNDVELLTVLQKTFRFAMRFWNNQAYTNCEKIFKEKTVIFPFSYSSKSAYRIVVKRDPEHKRLTSRGIVKPLIAYKYNDEQTPSGTDEEVDLSNFRRGGEMLLDNIQELKKKIEEKVPDIESSRNVINLIETEEIKCNSEFKYMPFEKQLQKLTKTQRAIVNFEDTKLPIRIEGPAGTGKTAALVLRAYNMLCKAKEKDEELYIYFFTHSKSTELSVKQMFERIALGEYYDNHGKQRIVISTLQEYCVRFINIDDTQVIDLDALEAKQYQLYLIADAFNNIISTNVLNTYRFILSDKTLSFFENEDQNKIIMMLQYEFSVRIKGISGSDLDEYKKLEPLENGIPMEKEADREFVFRVFKEYQRSLETQSVYDTDDIILEALARLNAPLWRRGRAKDGVDYLFIDEMHLFNLNEQQVFHFLTKDGAQKSIPFCFALDYGQVVGERSEKEESYIEKLTSQGNTIQQELSTVFRCSPSIAELCASITASGALLFDSFVNPYKFCETGFTAKEEEMCEVPKLKMYESDFKMEESLEMHITECRNKYKCSLSEIALIFFDEEMLKQKYTDKVGEYSVNYINGRKENGMEEDKNKVICSLPEYINGLEFKCVILVGVDEGRVPQSGIYDVSSNFLKYTALNKLYLACSRAKYKVLILGSLSRGESSCLSHSLANQSLVRE